MPDMRTGMLIILDGFGVNPHSEFNAVALAKMPHYTALLKKYSHTTLDASESHVGLPTGFMGNSEVGHLNIGAGRIVYQDFSLISHAIETGEFFQNPTFLDLFAKLKKENSANALHLMGLVSDGGVHSHISHLFALIRLAKQQGISRVYVHVFTDGRDTSPTSGKGYVKNLQDFCKDAGLGEIATISGRFYAMDRDNRWERVHSAYRAIVLGEAESRFSDPLSYIESSYDKNVTDEFLLPAVAKGYRGVQDGDGVIFFNFRADRAREISRAMTQTDFKHFDREKFPRLSGFVPMTVYDASLPLVPAYEKPHVAKTLGEYVSEWGGKQLRIAETEKYAHVTYFFSGGQETVFPGEKRILIPSPKQVKTYDLKPEMAAKEVTDALLKELDAEHYDLVVLNFANPDMVGHTGNLRAAIQALEVIDGCLGRIVSWIESHHALAILTADHGNCEKMVDDNGTPLTSHTLLPVPFIVIDPDKPQHPLLSDGRLCDIAPTLLALWGKPQPKEMTGHSLLEASTASHP